MIYADTHAHLYAEEFDDDRDAVIHRAIDHGVSILLLPNIDSTSIGPMMDLSSRFPENCYPMMGLHPGSVKENYRGELSIVVKHLNEHPENYAAVGEVGIDLYWDKTFRIQQEEVFRVQVQIALDHDLPLVIHTRNSFDVAVKILEEFPRKLRGIFHCFSGNAEQAQKAIDLGFKLGIGGVVTFKNSGLQQVVATTDISDIVLETDAPYLAPVPYRGQRNESSYLPYVAEKIAEIKDLRMDIVAETTTRTALDLFRIKKP